MNIAEYLVKYKLSCQEFGDKIGKSGEAVRLWKTGKRRPTKATARLIFRISKKEISMEEQGW